jgi:futalosine hydrolase
MVVTAVEAEAAAVVAGLDRPREVTRGPYRGLRADSAAGVLTVIASGVGPARAAACTATVLTLEPADLVVNAGIAGGFSGSAAPGDIVVGDRVVHADLGADSPEGFLPHDALPHDALPYDALPYDALPLDDSIGALSAGLVAQAAERTAAVVGPVLTVSTATGTAERTAELARRHRPVAEAMEGAGVHAAAQAHGVPFLEIRAVSNVVGPRDRGSWQVDAALTALGRAFAALTAAPLAELAPTGPGTAR